MTAVAAPSALPAHNWQSSSQADAANATDSWKKQSHSHRQEAEARAAALGLLFSADEVTLGGGWEDAPLDDDGKRRAKAASSSHSSTQVSSPTERSPSPNTGIMSPNAGSQAQESLSSSGLLVRSVKQGWERSFELHGDWTKPSIEKPDQVLVRNVAVGLNPVDFKSILYNFGISGFPWVLGRDICGVVEEVGSAVKGIKPGQRVWTCADSRDVRAGAYQSFSLCRAPQLGLLPGSDVISDDGVATLGTGLVTAAVAAYWFFRFPRAQSLGGGPVPRSKTETRPALGVGQSSKPWVLIYGGGAITGIFFAQLARLSGFNVLAVASENNFEYLLSEQVGVTECISRYLEADELLKHVHRITGGGLEYGIDCVGSKTASIVQKALSQSKGEGEAELICLAGNPKPAPAGAGAEEEQGEAKELRKVTAHRISFSTTFYGDDVFSRALLDDVERLLASGELRPARPVLVPDGLAGVRKGLESLRDGTAPGAHKLVVRLADTPHPELCNLGVRSELGWNGVA